MQNGSSILGLFAGCTVNTVYPIQWITLFLCGLLVFLLKVNDDTFLPFILIQITFFFRTRFVSVYFLEERGKKPQTTTSCCDFKLLVLGVARSHCQCCACSKVILFEERGHFWKAALPKQAAHSPPPTPCIAGCFVGVFICLWDGRSLVLGLERQQCL